MRIHLIIVGPHYVHRPAHPEGEQTMMRMSRTALAAAALFGLAAGGLILAAGARGSDKESPKPPTLADFADVKEVRLARGPAGPRAQAVVVTDKAKIERLVAAIKLEKKTPCGCDHIESAVFVTPKGDITVSLCAHCFDIGHNTYRMPPEFYRLFTACLADEKPGPGK
jgi:hypothetical protein